MVSRIPNAAIATSRKQPAYLRRHHESNRAPRPRARIVLLMQPHRHRVEQRHDPARAERSRGQHRAKLQRRSREGQRQQRGRRSQSAEAKRARADSIAHRAPEDRRRNRRALLREDHRADLLPVESEPAQIRREVPGQHAHARVVYEV
jgi:hypothetical protein